MICKYSPNNSAQVCPVSPGPMHDKSPIMTTNPGSSLVAISTAAKKTDSLDLAQALRLIVGVTGSPGLADRLKKCPMEGFRRASPPTAKKWRVLLGALLLICARSEKRTEIPKVFCRLRAICCPTNSAMSHRGFVEALGQAVMTAVRSAFANSESDSPAPGFAPHDPADFGKLLAGKGVAEIASNPTPTKWHLACGDRVLSGYASLRS
jgi:hypothetical protein